MRPFANLSLNDYRHFKVLFWSAVVISKGEFLYSLIFRNETLHDVSSATAYEAMKGAEYIKFPVICLN